MSISDIRFGGDHALFLDLDGTLVDVAPTPDAVRAAPQMITCLEAARSRLGGALAIISGRPVAQVLDIVSPLDVAVAGAHGGERRDAAGRDTRLPDAEADQARALHDQVQGFAAAHPGLLVERKHGSVALHYRRAPEMAEESARVMRAAAPAEKGWTIVPGKMVIEARRAGVSKGDAIAAFMTEAPFAGRMPLFVGDDVTDEDGFVRVQEMGGIGIKVGPGETAARDRLAGPGAVRAWLASASGLPERTSV